LSLARNTLVQSFLTLGSRVLGFARDIFLNARFGQGPMMDIWATALAFPNLFRRLFAEGAFAQAFVPVYAKIREEQGEAEAQRVASQVMSFLMVVVAGFCIAMQLAMSWIMPVLLSAYTDQTDIMRLAVFATQLTMPYLACMTMASLLQGVLNTAGRFALAAAAPMLLNVCTIAPLLVISDPGLALQASCVAVTLAGVLQAILLWWGARRLGVRLAFGAPALSPIVRRVVVLAVPGAIAGGAMQINTLVSQVLTGADEGAKAVLYNADRLYQLPLGLVGVAVGLALVPRLARAFVEKDEAAGQTTMDEGITLAMALTLPAAAALFIMPFFIIDATVTRGAFTSEDARRTAEVLRLFALGVPAFVLAKVFTPPFFAREDTKRPMRFALITVAITTLLGAALFFGLRAMGQDGVRGIAIASAVGAWVNVALLSGVLAREGAYRVSPPAWNKLRRVAAATAVMSAAVAVMAFLYAGYGDGLRLIGLGKEAAIVVACLLAAGIYGLAALALRAVSPTEVRRALRREAGPRLPEVGEG
jgi:putative peptidoglycan lipid II flippase